MKQKNYKKTLIACYLGFVTQAISANFAPLLFLTFMNTYGISNNSDIGIDFFEFKKRSHKNKKRVLKCLQRHIIFDIIIIYV